MKSSRTASAGVDQHSGRTRVTPVFTWLQAHGRSDWVTELLRLADGIQIADSVGNVMSVCVGKEREVEPSPARLGWMIRNAHRLAPTDGRLWREYRRRVTDNPGRDEALRTLDDGDAKGLSKNLKLEGSTHADCLIECERAFVWIEGKRNDWLSPSIKWDVTRDQLARNLDAVWQLAGKTRKDFWLLICHEHDLKHHEQELVDGYRAGTWKAGFPHLSEDTRLLFRQKIGTVRWQIISRRWPALPPAEVTARGCTQP
jgi:hypothetical protein